MQFIKIFGGTGTGKSMFADYIEATAKLGGISVAVSDHELLSSDKNYEKSLEKIKSNHQKMSVDLSILVINDAGPNMKVDFGGRVSYGLSCILFPRANRT